MNPLVIIFKIAKMRSFNKANHTAIHSLYAGLSAKYGIAVRIDSNVRVTSDVTIGDYSYVNHSSSLQNCDIGKFCSISSNVNINPYNHNLNGLTTHPVGDYQREQKRIVIGNDVLISLNVTILEGVHIGDGAVIGAGAVVTHDVGKYEIWGGVPARFLRYRVADEMVREHLDELKWWDMEYELQKRYIERYRFSLKGIEFGIAEGREDHGQSDSDNFHTNL